MKVCPNCGKQYPDDANFCPVDAGRLAPDDQVKQAQASAPAQAAADADSGKLLGGRFELGEHIGGGLTGEVHRAVDKKTGSTCAVKLVDASVFPSSLLMQRTERELKQLARLDHQGIVKVLAHDRDGDILWIASEMCDAQSLYDKVFDEGPMGPKDASQVILDIGLALSAAAKVGVTHRDLSPKNILVTADNVVKIINFGVATPAVNGTPGVPEFVAPEMIEGKAVDQRANIYSIGALYYFLLSGRAPYTGEPEEVHKQHLAGDVDPVSEHIDGIPELVDAVVLKALERQSRKRFMTLRQLLNAVEQLAQGNFDVEASPAITQRMGKAGGKSKDRKKALSQTMLGFSSSQSQTNIPIIKDDDSSAKPPQALDDASADDAAKSTASDESGAASDDVVGAPVSTQPMDLRPKNKPSEEAAPDAAAQASPGSLGDTLKEPSSDIDPATTTPMGTGATAGKPVATIVSDSGPTPEPTPVAAAERAVPPEAQTPRAPTIPPVDNMAEANKQKVRERKEAARAKRRRGGDKFRETLWFKKGKLDEEAAKDSASKTGEDIPTDKADLIPMEDRYEDDGSVTSKDQEQYSLKTGSTQSMEAFSDNKPVAASEVSDEELISEMKGGRGKVIAALIIGLLAIAGVIAYAISGGGHGGGDDKPKEEKSTKPSVDDLDKLKPDGTPKDGTKPDGTKPDGAKPDGTQPDDAKPDGTKPDGTKPDGTKPDGMKPDGTKPDGAKPAEDAKTKKSSKKKKRSK